MGSPEVIADVSDILLKVLTAAVHESDATAQVRLVELVGQQQGGSGVLGLELFLYEVAEDPSTRNRPPRRTVVVDPAGGAVRQERRRADMALLLRYLVIPTGRKELSEHLPSSTILKYGVGHGQLTIHSDRGSPMVAENAAQMMSSLDVTKSHS